MPVEVALAGKGEALFDRAARGLRLVGDQCVLREQHVGVRRQVIDPVRQAQRERALHGVEIGFAVEAVPALLRLQQHAPERAGVGE
jgi:hypothetical protein